MKHYQYEKKRFMVQVTITGIFCAILAMISIVFMVQGFMPAIMAIVFIVSVYTVFNTFIAKTTPETIDISKHQITFGAYNQEARYTISQLKEFRIREFPTSGKMYIRVNDYSLLKGRYWVQTKMFNDSKELFMELLDIEYTLHPESLKARARRVNTEYNEKAALNK